MKNASTERMSQGLIPHGWRLPVQFVEIGAGALDAAVIVSVSVLASAGFHGWVYGEWGDVELYLGLGIIVAVLFVPWKLLQGHYRPVELLDFRRQVRRLLTEWLFTFVLLTGIAFALKSGAVLSRGATLSFAVLGLLALLLVRALWHRAL